MGIETFRNHTYLLPTVFACERHQLFFFLLYVFTYFRLRSASKICIWVVVSVVSNLVHNQLESCEKVFKLSDISKLVVWKLACRCQVLVMQLSGTHKVMVRQSSGNCHFIIDCAVRVINLGSDTFSNPIFQN